MPRKKKPAVVEHPMQPLVDDGKGRIRFKANSIVKHLLDEGNLNLNDLARLEFSKEDWTQFAQLIGYSLDGFGELSYVSNEDYDAACAMYKNGKDTKSAREGVRAELLRNLRKELRKPIAELYDIHPDDLRVI